MLGQTTSRAGWPSVSVFITSVVLVLLTFPLAAQTSSNVRIVRLSFVEGTVNLHRPGVNEWAKAFTNTPIQQGFELATDANSFAEVEFENGSTARLGQTTSLNFTELSLGADGNKVNRMSLGHGYATFTVSPERGDLYLVDTPQGSFTADGKSMFRIDLGGNDARLEVFKGHVQVQSPYGGGAVAGNHVLEIRPGDPEAYQVTRGITADAWDRWVEQRNNQAQVARNMGGYRSASAYGSPYSSLYGWNELSYYGNWMNLPGYGNCWFPFVATGWMPYTLGWWSFYPGFGYTWISSLPWGWLPFHYGNWIFASGYGWGWMPGNFGYWSPAVVNWYQGPGWIGWYPYAGRFRTTTHAGCRPGVNCATAVSLNTFQNGGLVTPNTLMRVNPAQGRRIASPNVTPTRFARLPGPVVSGPVVVRNSQSLQTTSTSAGASPGTRPSKTTFVMRRGAAGVAPTTVLPNLPPGFGIRSNQRIVFNPATHQYESGSTVSTGLNVKPRTTPSSNGATQGIGSSVRTITPQQPVPQAPKTVVQPQNQSFPRPGRIPLNTTPAANLVPKPGSTIPLRTIPVEHQTLHVINKNVVPLSVAPGFPSAGQRGNVRSSSVPARQLSAPEGLRNRSNTTFRNNTPRSEPKMNRGMQQSAPRMQPSGGFGSGRSMGSSPSRMGGGMGGGVQQPRGGTGTPGGPHR